MKQEIYKYLKKTPWNTNYRILDQMLDTLSAQALLSESSQLEVLIETDMLPAIHTQDRAILTDENGNIILRF